MLTSAYHFIFPLMHSSPECEQKNQKSDNGGVRGKYVTDGYSAICMLSSRRPCHEADLAMTVLGVGYSNDWCPHFQPRKVSKMGRPSYHWDKWHSKLQDLGTRICGTQRLGTSDKEIILTVPEESNFCFVRN